MGFFADITGKWPSFCGETRVDRVLDCLLPWSTGGALGRSSSWPVDRLEGCPSVNFRKFQLCKHTFPRVWALTPGLLGSRCGLPVSSRSGHRPLCLLIDSRGALPSIFATGLRLLPGSYGDGSVQPPHRPASALGLLDLDSPGEGLVSLGLDSTELPAFGLRIIFRTDRLRG